MTPGKGGPHYAVVPTQTTLIHNWRCLGGHLGSVARETDKAEQLGWEAGAMLISAALLLH